MNKNLKIIIKKNKHNKMEEKIEYQVLGEDYPSYDYSFKVIVIGNSGKYSSNISN